MAIPAAIHTEEEGGGFKRIRIEIILDPVNEIHQREVKNWLDVCAEDGGIAIQMSAWDPGNDKRGNERDITIRAKLGNR